MKTCHAVEEAAWCLMQRLNQFSGKHGLLCKSGLESGGHCRLSDIFSCLWIGVSSGQLGSFGHSITSGQWVWIFFKGARLSYINSAQILISYDVWVIFLFSNMMPYGQQPPPWLWPVTTAGEWTKDSFGSWVSRNRLCHLCSYLLASTGCLALYSHRSQEIQPSLCLERELDIWKQQQEVSFQIFRAHALIEREGKP